MKRDRSAGSRALPAPGFENTDSSGAERVSDCTFRSIRPMQARSHEQSHLNDRLEACSPGARPLNHSFTGTADAVSVD